MSEKDSQSSLRQLLSSPGNRDLLNVYVEKRRALDPLRWIPKLTLWQMVGLCIIAFSINIALNYDTHKDKALLVLCIVSIGLWTVAFVREFRRRE